MTFSCMRHNRLKEISVYKSGNYPFLRTAKSAKISRWKPGILLSLSASKNNTFRTLTRRKKQAVVLYPFWFIQVEVLAYYYA